MQRFIKRLTVLLLTASLLLMDIPVSSLTAYAEDVSQNDIEETLGENAYEEISDDLTEELFGEDVSANDIEETSEEEKNTEEIIGDVSLNEDGPNTPKVSFDKATEADENGFVIVDNKITKYVGTATEIVIPNNVIAIDGSVFKDRTEIKSIDFSKSKISEISYRLCMGCTGLESVTIGASVKKIGASAFEGCTKLEAVELPSVLEDIGDRCFYNTGLAEISIPKTLKRIGANSFADCTSLEKVVYNAASIKSVDYSYDAFVGSTKLSTVEIGTTVARIPAYFLAKSSVKTINIPDSVKEIGRNAFAESSLETITGLNKVTTIEEYAFLKTPLKAISLPDTLSSLGEGAFKETNLTEITIPKNISQMGNSVFYNCTALETVNYNSINLGRVGYEGLQEYATFGNCVSLSNVNIGSLVTRIPSNLFAYSTIETIDIPSNVSAIGSNAFNCSGLESISGMSKVQKIEYNAFRNLGNLTEINLPETLTTIGEMAFASTGLKKIVLPSNVTEMDNSTFKDCASLTEVEFNSIKLEIVGFSATDTDTFQNCNLEKVTIGNKVSTIPGNFLRGSSIEKIDIPANVTTIGARAFESSSLKEISGMEKVQKIGDSAFNSTPITSIILPDSLTEIGSRAFALTELTEITIPKNVNKMGEAAFYNNASLKTFYFNAVNLSSAGYYTTTARPLGDCTNLESIVIGSSVTRIPSYLFHGMNNNVKAIDIPKAVTEIGSYAFRDSAIETVTGMAGVKNIDAYAFADTDLISVPLCEGLTKIDDHAFMNTEIEEVILPKSLTTLENNAFEGCVDLKKVIVKSIKLFCNAGRYGDSYYPFRNCTSLDEIVFEDGVTEIPASICAGTRVKNVVVPKGVKIINNYAFADCLNLETLTLPDGLLEIKNQILVGSSLTKLVVPASVTSIYYAFRDTTNLEEVILGGNITSAYGAFSGCSPLLKICVPKGSKTEETLRKAGYGEYIVNVNTINYVLNGGSNNPLNPIICKQGDVITLYAPSRTGYTFAGWYLDKELKKPVSETYTVGSGAVSFYAKWTANKYTVVYVGNFPADSFGSGNVDSQTVSYGQKVAANASKFVATKYSFVCWNTKPDGTGTSIYPTNKNKKYFSNLCEEDGGTAYLYAIWAPSDFTIEYDSNAGAIDSKVTGKVNPQKTKYRSEFELSGLSYKASGYKFMGWSTDGINVIAIDDISRTVIESIAIDNKGTVTLYAVWEPIQYTLVLNPNIAGVNPFEPIVLKYDEVISSGDESYFHNEAVNAANNGKDVVSWNTKADGTGKKYNLLGLRKLTTVDGANVTLYAQWKQPKYSIKYNYDGGKLPNGVKNPSSFTTTVTGVLSVNWTDPIKTGYVICGYIINGIHYDLSQLEIGEKRGYLFWSLLAGENLSVKAEWAPIEYKVKIICPDGTEKNVDMEYGEDFWKNSQVVSFFESYGLYRVKAVKDAKNKSYAPGKALKNLAVTEGAVVELHVVNLKNEKTNRYRIKFTSLPEGVADEVISVQYNELASLNERYTSMINAIESAKPGYTIKSWKYSSKVSYAPDKLWGLTDVENGEIIVTPVYTAKTYSITYLYRIEGEVITPEASDEISKYVKNKNASKYTFGKTLKLSNPTANNIAFLNWTVYGTDTSIKQINSKNVGEVILVGTFKKDSAKLTYNYNYKSAPTDSVDCSGKYTETIMLENSKNLGTIGRSGYELVGWNTKANGKGVHYDLGAEVIFAQLKGKTLYAEWKKISMKAPKILSIKIEPTDGAMYNFCVCTSTDNDGDRKDDGLEYILIEAGTDTVIETVDCSGEIRKTDLAGNYYMKVRSYKSDSTGERVYSSYSRTIRLFNPNK